MGAGHHVGLTEPVGCVPTEQEQNSFLFLSNRVMIREQALLRPVMCQRVEDALAACASRDTGAPPICFHPACNRWLAISWLLLIGAYELWTGKNSRSSVYFINSVCLLGPSSTLPLDNHAAREPPGGEWRFSQGPCSLQK